MWLPIAEGAVEGLTAAVVALVVALGLACTKIVGMYRQVRQAHREENKADADAAENLFQAKFRNLADFMENRITKIADDQRKAEQAHAECCVREAQARGELAAARLQIQSLEKLLAAPKEKT